MPRHTVHIAAPAADVYARITDPRRRPEWLPELIGTSDVPDQPLREGDRFVGYAELLGHRLVGHSEVRAADAASGRLEERVVIGARFTTTWDVTPTTTDGSACRVTHDIDVEFPQGPLGNVVRWLLTRYLDRLQRRGLQRLAGRSGRQE